MKKEWLEEKKELCERGIEFYQNKVKMLERDLKEVESLIDFVEGQSKEKGTAQ